MKGSQPTGETAKEGVEAVGAAGEATPEGVALTAGAWVLGTSHAER